MRETGRWLVIVFMAGLWGCSMLPPEAGTQTPVITDGTALPAGEGWWYARFHVERADGESTRWHIDALLAGEVIAPVFDTHYRDILIWRVHRRAAQDRHGHVFSFIFYATPAAAQRTSHPEGSLPIRVANRPRRRFPKTGPRPGRHRSRRAAARWS